MLGGGQAQSMAGFVLRRVLWTIPILWIVVTIVFFMMRSIGGDPFRHGKLVGLSNVGWVKYGDYQPPAIRKNQREKYGLDLSWYEQYGNYLKGVATLDLGPSLSFKNLRVEDIIREVGPRSLELALLAFAWAVVIGIPVGIVAALRPGSWVELRRLGARARLHGGHGRDRRARDHDRGAQPARGHRAPGP